MNILDVGDVREALRWRELINALRSKVEAEGGELTARRTAAASALAADYLACGDAGTLVVIGAGDLAAHEACRRAPIRRVRRPR